MHPTLWGMNSFPFIVAAAIVIGTLVNFFHARRSGVALGPTVAFLAALAFVGLVGAKLYSIAMIGGVSDFRTELTVGWRYPGGILAILLAMPLLVRLFPKDLGLLGVGDLVAPGAAFAMAVMRVECLLVGCCAGGVCHLPWALSFPRPSQPWGLQVLAGEISQSAAASLPVHPLQLYFMAVSLAVGCFVLWLAPRKRFNGQLLLWYLVLHESGKFLLEFLRNPYELRLQVASFALASVAGLALLWMHRRESAPVLHTEAST